jgi:hypothetical protein
MLFLCKLTWTTVFPETVNKQIKEYIQINVLFMA